MNYFINLIAIFVIIITTIVIFLKHRLTYWNRRGVPGPTNVGLNAFAEYIHEYTLEEVRKYGRVFGTCHFFKRGITICEPDLIRDIMVKDFHIFPDHQHMNVGSLQKSLFFLPGNQDWKRIRSILTPAFTSGKLRAMMSHISDISDKFVNNMEVYAKTDEIVDIRKYVGAFSMDAISACAYGIDVDSINNPDHLIVVNAKKILGVDGNIFQVLSVLFPKIANFFKLEMFDKNGLKFFGELTNRIINERKNSNEYFNGDKAKRKTDFIQLMLDSEKNVMDPEYDSYSDDECDKNNEQKEQKAVGILSRDELTAQGILFFIAGYDTTSASISHAIYYLSQNKDCQQRLYEELKTINDFSYENLNQLKYLNAVINETLRLAPSFIGIQRECAQDYKLGNTGITIPTGTIVSILPYALHRLPEFWPEPEQFKPDRFIEPKHHPYAFVTFGGGPRLCIGQRFALNEMRMCLAKLFNRFEFSLAPDFQIEYYKGTILLTPKTLLVKIESRKQE